MTEAARLTLGVQNTFLHVKDPRTEALKLGRSASESSLSSAASSFVRHSPRKSSTPQRPRSSSNDSPAPRPTSEYFTNTSDHHIFSSEGPSSAASQSSPGLSGRSTPRSAQHCGPVQDEGGGSRQPPAPIVPPGCGDAGRGWSKGAELHELGQCSPCAWNWKPQGCHHSVNCAFCHLCPQGSIQQRRATRKKEAASRAQAQQAALAQQASYADHGVPPLAVTGQREGRSQADGLNPVGTLSGYSRPMPDGNMLHRGQLPPRSHTQSQGYANSGLNGSHQSSQSRYIPDRFSL